MPFPFTFKFNVPGIINPFSSSTKRRHTEYDPQEIPPLKKRRGLAGTVISTALNAALIGGAVGLTVYRLWRNRARQHEHQQIDLQEEEEAVAEPLLVPPPPPYVEAPHSPHFIDPIRPRSSKKARHTKQSRSVRRKGAHHRHYSSSSPSVDPFCTSISTTTTTTTTQPEFDFGSQQQQQHEVEDKMDWIGDKLSMLIDQGKRALNAQVVVMSDAKEDEVDDGSAAWEEVVEDDIPTTTPRSHSRSRSHHHHHHKRLHLTSSSGTSLPRLGDPPISVSAPPNNAAFFYEQQDRRQQITSASYSTTSLNNVSVEDPASFDSPELRESMERARQRLMDKRMGLSGVP